MIPRAQSVSSVSILLLLLGWLASSLDPCQRAAAIEALEPVQAFTTESIRIVIVRHGEKPADGDNLSCLGWNRSVALARVLRVRFGVPELVFVSRPRFGKHTYHVRMLQTITPFAVQHNLVIDSNYEVEDVIGLADSLRRRTHVRNRNVVVVWEVHRIHALATALGVDADRLPEWKADDFDTLWIVNLVWRPDTDEWDTSFYRTAQGLSDFLPSSCTEF